MTTVWSFIGVAASIQGIILSIVLFIHPKFRGKKSMLFSFLILGFSLWLAEFSFYWSTYLLKFPQFTFTTISLPWLFGPLLFLLTREFLNDNAKFEFKYFVHFLPFIFFFIWQLPEITADAEGKLKMLQLYIYSKNPQMTTIFYIFNGLLLFQIISYSTFTLISVKNTSSKETVFLGTLSIGLLIYSVQKLIHTSGIYFTGYEFIHEIGALSVLTCGALLYILTYISILNPSFLILTNISKYQKNKLSKEKINEVRSEVISYLLDKKQYQRKGLGLSIISHDTKLPSHYISQVVNSEYGININDLINKYRIEEIKKRLIDPNFTHYKILALALDAGFSNKASFYNAFKKLERCTPTEYLKNHSDRQSESTTFT